MTPPSAFHTAPVTQPASSESRNAAIAAISSGVPTRPIGWKGGHTADRDRIDENGRYFRHRSKVTLLVQLRRIGDVVDFATWSHFDDGGHYQWALVLRR
jgi:hypothetical protein